MSAAGGGAWSRLRTWWAVRLERLRPSGWRGARLTIGQRGEDEAARYLQQQGYRILARNLRSRYGEIDLLAQPGDETGVFVVVEVKASADDDSPIRPEQHVNRAKQRKIAGLAAQLLRRHRMQDHRVRFDVVGVQFPAAGDPIIRHHISAFASPW